MTDIERKDEAEEAETARLAGLRAKQRRQELAEKRVICTEVDPPRKYTPIGCYAFETCGHVRRILDGAKKGGGT